jgi:hypothetical protein
MVTITSRPSGLTALVGVMNKNAPIKIIAVIARQLAVEAIQPLVNLFIIGLLRFARSDRRERERERERDELVL